MSINDRTFCIPHCLTILLIFLNCLKQGLPQATNDDAHESANEIGDSSLDLENRRIKNNKHVRFLGDTPGTVFVNTVAIVAGIFVIWDWIETREDRKLPDNGELLEEWNSHLEGINSRMEDAKLSLKQLTCRLDTIHSKAISPECQQVIRPYKNPNTNNYAKSSSVENAIDKKTNPSLNLLHV